MGKHNQVTEVTKQKFIDVFCELYQQKPIEKITVQELTKLSGYNRSTFYQYFHDIYDLLEYIENDVLTYFRFTTSARLENLHNQDLVIRKIAQLYDDKGDYLIALLGDYGSVRFINKMTDIIEEHVEELGVYVSHLDDVLMPYIKTFFLSTTISMFKCWHTNNKSISSEELVTLIHNLVSIDAILQKKDLIPNDIIR